jgi:hypothetical protein
VAIGRLLGFALSIASASGALAACEQGEIADTEVGVVVVPVDAAPVAFVCPRVLPSQCPSPAPSWDGGVASIVGNVCGGCHADGGVEQAAYDFSTYAGVARNQASILTQVYSCAMPPADAGPLTNDQRQELLAWLICGAPNN